MATVKNKKSGLTTVGELIDALSRFPRDLPVQAQFDEQVTIYQCVPQKGEIMEDKRGYVQIDGADPFGDE